jgi:hypothetical protein
VAILHVYYKEKTGMRYRTDIRFGIEDFICSLISFSFFQTNFKLSLMNFVRFLFFFYVQLRWVDFWALV